MNRIHALTITLIVAIAVAVGGTAMSRSGASGAAPAATATSAAMTNANDQELNRAIAKRAKALDALEASLNGQLAAAAPTPAPSVQTVRVQAPPVVVTRHRSDGEGSDEHGGGGQDD